AVGSKGAAVFLTRLNRPVALGTLALSLLAVAAAAQVGTASDSTKPSSRDAARFLATVVRQLAASDYAAAWLTLHPVDQALVPFEQYVACESAHPVSGRLECLVDRMQRQPGS